MFQLIFLTPKGKKRAPFDTELSAPFKTNFTQEDSIEDKALLAKHCPGVVYFKPWYYATSRLFIHRGIDQCALAPDSTKAPAHPIPSPQRLSSASFHKRVPDYLLQRPTAVLFQSLYRYIEHSLCCLMNGSHVTSKHLEVVLAIYLGSGEHLQAISDKTEKKSKFY